MTVIGRGPVTRREKRQLWVLLAVVAVIFEVLFWRGKVISLYPHGDGFHSWMYATSLAFDGDLDLTNDYTICGHTDFAAILGPRGIPVNYLYFGPALIWTPLIKLGSLFFHTVGSEARACSGPITDFVGAFTPVFVVLTLYFTYLCMRRYASHRASIVSMLTIAFGSTIVAYSSIFWFYCHLYSALGVSLALLLGFRANEAPSPLRYAAHGAAIGVAALMRPQVAVWMLVGILPLAWTFVTKPDRRRHAFVCLAAMGAASLLLYSPQFLVYKRIFDTYWLVPHGKYYLNLGHAHPFLLLFNPYSGLLATTPLMWIGTIGLFALPRREPRLVGIGILVAACADVFVASACLPYEGASTSGARLVTSIVPALGIAGALVYDRVFAFLSKRRRAAAVAVAAVIAPILFIGLNVPWCLYGEAPAIYTCAQTSGWNEVSKRIGNPFTLPATLVFRLRYHAGHEDFDRLAYVGMFVHFDRLWTLAGTSVLHFAAPPREFAATRGFRKTACGLELENGEGRFLVTLYWPWITDVRLKIRTLGPDSVHAKVKSRGFFFSHDVAEMDFAGVTNETWHVAAGTFDSGFNEVIVETSGPICLDELEWFDTTPRTPGP